MAKNIFHNEIDLLLERLRRRHDSLKKIEGRPPRLEVDIMLSDLRTLYEFCHELANLPDEFLNAAETPVEQITAPVENTNVETTTVEPTAAPVIEPEPIAQAPAPVVVAEVKVPESPVQPAVEPTPAPSVALTSEPVAQVVPSIEKPDSKPFATLAETRSNTITRANSASTSLRDRFEDTPTLNDHLIIAKPKKSVGTEIKLKPITDLRTAIGINEKFIFVRDLFNGNREAFEQALDGINQATDHADAERYINDGPASSYNWKSQNKFVRADFMELVQRRFL